MITCCIVYTAGCQTIGKPTPKFSAHFYCGQTAGCKMPLGMEVGLSPGDFVCLSCPVLSVMLVYCGQTVGWIKMKLGTQVGLGPGHIVLDGDPAPPPQKGGTAHLFSAHVYSGQTAARIKMPLGTEVGQDDIALGEDPAPPPQKWGGASSPIFGPCLLWPNGWIDQDGIWHGGGPYSSPHCTRWGPSSPPQKGGIATPLIFRPFLLWPNGWMDQESRCHSFRRQASAQVTFC